MLFYRLAKDHLEEVLPIIYTPIVGRAVKEFSIEFRRTRGLYIAHTDQDHIVEILKNRTNPEVDIIVVTDGEAILGIGDQGIGGMDIPVAKLMVYTLCGGINHLNTLPIMLDVGTNNQALLDNPLYLGKRHKRISEPAYSQFIEKFTHAIKKVFPNTFLHWEDLGRHHAQAILNRYQDSMCTFNDDIQGTGVVTLAALLTAIKSNKSDLSKQRIVIFGAGNAGCGIAEQILDAMIRQGVPKEEAYKHFWLIDRHGLVINNQQALTDEQHPFARDAQEVADWQQDKHLVSFEETIKQVKPTVLIGCSAVANAFNKRIVQYMAKHCDHPIIFPLSNPTERVEATPKNLLDWTQGRARVATGSPFPAAEYNQQIIEIAQCNNALAFPGIGLGITISQAKRLSQGMLWAATEALVKFQTTRPKPHAVLLPGMKQGPAVAKVVALAVAKKAREEGLSKLRKQVKLEALIEKYYWDPHYTRFYKK